VICRRSRKDIAMRSNLLLVAALGCALAGCNTLPDDPARGVASVNVPVVTTADYTFAAAAPGESLAPGEAERLDGFFRGLGLGYGDSIFVDGPDASAARGQVAQLAGRYGLLIQQGAPVLAGQVQPGTVRVIVSRRRAEVPGCPNWSRPAQPDYSNQQASNFGCAVNSNLAAMIADPVDLIHGRDGGGVNDNRTATRAVDMYRSTPPSGTKGLPAVTTTGGK
jgi:pilus assembly protein CpaD